MGLPHMLLVHNTGFRGQKNITMHSTFEVTRHNTCNTPHPKSTYIYSKAPHV